MDKLFESIYNEALLLEDRSKHYYLGFYKSGDGKWVQAPIDVCDTMNQLKKREGMIEFLKRKYKGRDVKIEEDESIGWEKQGV